MKQYSKVDWKQIPLWKDVSARDWFDYKWQLKNVIKDILTLDKVVKLDDAEKKTSKIASKSSPWQ